MKIWIKSPDPNHQCCECDNKIGPCDSCSPCNFFSSGSPLAFIPNTYTLEAGYNTFNKICSTNVLSDSCSVCNAISSFSLVTGLDYTQFLTGISRKFQSQIVSDMIQASIIDGGQRISIEAGTGAREAGGGFWSIDYIISSNLSGLFISGNNLNNTNSIDYFNSFFNSGDILNIKITTKNNDTESSAPIQLFSPFTGLFNYIETNDSSSLDQGNITPIDLTGKQYPPIRKMQFSLSRPTLGTLSGFIKFNTGMCIFARFFASIDTAFLPASTSLTLTDKDINFINPLAQFSPIIVVGDPFFETCISGLP